MSKEPDWSKIGTESCEHGLLPPEKTKSGKWSKGGCEKCKIKLDVSAAKPKFRYYEYLCKIKFEKIFGVGLKRKNICEFRFDGGSFEKFNLLTEYKSGKYDGPSNWSDQWGSFNKMCVAELELKEMGGGDVLKVMIFRSRALAEKFLKKFRKWSILPFKAGIKPNSVQIWWFKGDGEPYQLY